MTRSFSLAVVVLLVALAAPAQTNGPVAAFAFDDGGTVGRFGPGLSFSGGAGGRVVPVTGLSNAFTFEAWIKPSSFVWSDFWQQRPDSPGNPIYTLSTTPTGAIYFSAYQGNTSYPIVTVPTLALGVWTHVAATYDGAAIRIYFDAVEVGRRNAGGDLMPTSQPMEIGAGFPGGIDEVRIYDRALTAGEIALDRATPIDPAEPFQVSVVTPAGQAHGVSTTPVSATFSAAANPATVTSSTFELRDAANVLVPATVSYDPATRTALLVPSNLLLPLSDYTARVAGGSGGVADAVGATLPGDGVWTFRTAAASTAPRVAYAFSEGAGASVPDGSGNGNSGTLLHGATWAAGMYGGGLQLDGVNDDVQVPAHDTTAMAGAFTFEAWVKPAAYAWGDIWSQYPDNSVNYIYDFAITDTGALYTALHVGDTDYPMFTTVTLPLGVWTHVALTYDSARLRIFVEGLEVASRAAHGSLAATPEPMEIGQWFHGSIDEVRIYDRALTAGEIAVDRQTPVDAATPFVVTMVTPQSGAVGVLSTPITAAFSAAVDPATLTAGAFTLRDAGGASVAASVAYSPANRTATLSPVSGLLAAGDYTARVSSAVTSSGGIPLAGDVTWSFRTAAGPSLPSAAYAFSEGSGATTDDWSGNGNRAALVRGAGWGSGRVGNALSLAGTDGEVLVPASDSIALTTAFTFEGWVNLSAAGQRLLWSRNPDDTSGPPLYQLSTLPAATIYFNARLGGTDFPLWTSAALSLSVWTHVAVTFDGSRLRIYLNGVEAASRNASGALGTTNEPMEIGNGFAGQLDEIRIYRRALDPAEIAVDMAMPVDARQSVITALAPASGPAGQVVTIAGLNFGAAQAESVVAFNGVAAAVSAWSDTAIAATVPQGATSGPVVVTKQGVASNGMTFTVIPPPAISAISPTSGAAGQAVTITGANFGSAQGASSVTFNGVLAPIVSWSAASITASVPAAATSGPVLVIVNGQTSNGVTFTVNGPRIAASVSPSPNSLGWNSSAVTVTFTCTATDSPIASCTSPQTISFGGAGIKVTGRATDQNGVTAILVVVLNVDLVGPAVNVYVPATSAVFPLETTTVAVKGSAFDVLSGNGFVTCAGTPATVIGQNFSCTVPVENGSNTIQVVASDLAGRTTTRNLSILVADVAPASLTISPATMTLVAGNEQPLAVTDERGRSVTGGAWSSSAPNVAAVVVAAGGASVQALAAGSATLTLTRDGLSAQAVVTVLAADATPPSGTTLWSLTPTPNPQPGLTPGVREIVRGASSPALFFVEHGAYYQNQDTTVVPTVIRAVTVDGRELWKYSLPADPLFGGYAPVKQVVADDRGGLVVVVSSSRPVCCFGMNEVIRRIDGLTGLISWEYWHRETFGRFSEVAIHPNGTIFVVEKLSSADSTHLLALYGDTGGLQAEWDLTFGHSTYPNGSNATGPLVQADGSVVVVVSQWDNVTLPSAPRTAWRATLQTPMSTALVFDALAHPDSTAVNFGVGDIMGGPWPDGQGGLVVGGVSPQTNSGLASLVHVGADLIASPLMTLPFGTSAARDLQYILSDDAAYALVQYWEGSATTGAKAYKINPASLGVLDSFDLAGGPYVQFTSAMAGGGTLYTSHAFNDAVQIGYGLTAGWANGAPVVQAAPTVTEAETKWPHRRGVMSRKDATNPRLGIFVKGQFVIAPFFHTSLRIVPRDQDRWAWTPGFQQDTFGAWYLTIGAESDTENCSGLLKSDLNRPHDLDPTNLIYRERLLYSLNDEARLITALLQADANYLDELSYACKPLSSDDTYNSNSYTHGLLNKVGLPSPLTPFVLPYLHFGWLKAVPSSEFDHE